MPEGPKCTILSNLILESSILILCYMTSHSVLNNMSALENEAGEEKDIHIKQFFTLSEWNTISSIVFIHYSFFGIRTKCTHLNSREGQTYFLNL